MSRVEFLSHGWWSGVGVIIALISLATTVYLTLLILDVQEKQRRQSVDVYIRAQAVRLSFSPDVDYRRGKVAND